MAGQSVHDKLGKDGKPGPAQRRHRSGRSRSLRRKSREPVRQRSPNNRSTPTTAPWTAIPAPSMPAQASPSGPRAPQILSQPTPRVQLTQQGSIGGYKPSDPSRAPGQQRNKFSRIPSESVTGTVSLDNEGVEALRSIIESIKARTGAGEAVVRIEPLASPQPLPFVDPLLSLPLVDPAEGRWIRGQPRLIYKNDHIDPSDPLRPVGYRRGLWTRPLSASVQGPNVAYEAVNGHEDFRRLDQAGSAKARKTHDDGKDKNRSKRKDNAKNADKVKAKGGSKNMGKVAEKCGKDGHGRIRPGDTRGNQGQDSASSRNSEVRENIANSTTEKRQATVLPTVEDKPEEVDDWEMDELLNKGAWLA